MKLRVAFRDAGASEPVNVQITADATATAADVARALARGPGGREDIDHEHGLTLNVSTDGAAARTVPPDALLVQSGLRSGGTVHLVSAPRDSRSDRRETVAVLRVVSGPDAGVEVPLPEGSSRIGRAPDCQVRLTDRRVSKQHARIDISDVVELVDLGAANGIEVGGVRVNRVALGRGDSAVLGESVIQIDLIRRPASVRALSTDISFMRSPRVLSRRTEEKVDLPAPPGETEASKLPWLAMLAPLIMGGVMFAVTQSALTIAFVALSPILMLGNWLAQRADTKRKRKAAREAFHAELAAAGQSLAARHDLERRQLLALHPSVSECVQAISDLTDVLWSRRPEHPEFLAIRLGLGGIRPLTEIEGTTRPGRAEFTEPRDALVSAHRVLENAPVVADLRTVGGLGIAGAPGIVDGVARAVVAQVAALHSPSEVTLACLTSAQGKPRWSWLEWLPHVAPPQSPLGPLHLSADAGTGRVLLDQLEGLVNTRLADSEPSLRGPLQRESPPDPVVPSILVVVDEPMVDFGRLIRLAERGPDAGVYVLWVSQSKSGLPAACRTYLDLGSGHSVKVGFVRTGELFLEVRCETLDAATAESVGRRLAPVVDAGAATEDASDVPRVVSVVSVLGAESVDDPEQVLAHWRENGSWVDRSAAPHPRDRAGDLRAPVGHTGSEPFTLDLRTQGPHALVGGTTGSGKSEFLQAWVLGLAHAYSPDRVTFLFVDYKGGAAFAKCVELPHCVGMVTDLSAHLVRRALRSLRAEIHHRETLLQDKGVKDLIDFELTGDPACPPSLIIVVDEFAALKSEVPEFVDGVVDVAQRGRSLGLHLIMATQRPAGVITDSLRANTNLRVALRMNDDHDSTDVLGSTLAGRFDPSIPGRGAARTGPGRITQFQSAFPGARTAAAPQAPPIQIVELDFGPGRPWKLVAPAASGPKPFKDIDRLVDCVSRAAQLGNVPAPRRPWLETLASAYNLEKLSQRTDTKLVLGVIDNPDRQQQDTVHFEPDAQGNILFFGAGGSGKTSALRTLALASGITPRGGPVHVYGLDFGGGGLGLLEPLPYVGSIIGGDDEERVARLMRYLLAIIEEREPRYAAAKASSLADYRRLAARPEEPRILLLLDGFQTFRTEYDATVQRSQVYAAFQKIAAQGRSCGVHVAATSDRLASVPNAIANTFLTKVILRQADDDGYLAAGVPRDVLSPASPPGRGMLVGNPQELQLAILGTSGTPLAQAEEVAGLARYLEPQMKNRPEPIRSLPERVSGARMPTSVGGLPVLGVEDVSLAPFGFDPRSPIIVAGPPQSGRTTALRWLAEAIHRWSPETPLVHLSARKSSLGSLALWTASMTGAAAVQKYVSEQLKPYLEQSTSGLPIIAVFAENYAEFGGSLAEPVLGEIATLARRNSHPLIVEGEPSGMGGFQAFLNEVRQARTALLLQPDQNDGDNLVRTPLPRLKRTDFPPGRGMWVRAGKTHKIQIPVVG